MVRPIPHFFRDGVEYKICKGCSKELELVCFGKYSRAHDGLKHKCRACLSKKPFTEPNPNSPTKICALCVVRKEKSEFRGNRSHCKTCEKAQGRAYRHTHKEKAKAWTEANRERMSELQHQWYVKNRMKIRKIESWRMYNDPHFRRIKYYRMSINGMLRGTHLRNKYLKCSRTDLWKWFEFLFSDGMTKANYGKAWVVDHVIPIATLKTSPDNFSPILQWQNLAPVSVLENLRKNRFINKEQTENHLEKVREYCISTQTPLDKDYINLCAKHLAVRETPDLVASPDASTQDQHTGGDTGCAGSSSYHLSPETGQRDHG